MSNPTLNLRIHPSIHHINAVKWDACNTSGNPFTSHAFLSALEDSGSVSGEKGWLPQHVSLSNAEGIIRAVIPLYLKSHSYGEYVFDHSWANALQRAGDDYYPKIQIAVPFSPVPGPRLLQAPDSELSIEDIGGALRELCGHFEMSSSHITFCTEQEWMELGDSGWLQRLGMQFHWQNQDYHSFDDFLDGMSSRHRKSIRRERREANNCGLDFKTIVGSSIQSQDWDAFYRFYQSTIDRKWGSAYLTRQFFTLLSERLGDKVILMTAEHNGQPVAAALNIQGPHTLYGRNWGCTGDWPFLHFELCYYRAIDYAIANKLMHVEAGAQGEHKIKRGYLPQLTYSAHWIRHDGLAGAVKTFLFDERAAIMAETVELAAFSPFRKV